MENQSRITPETARGRSARVWAFVAAGVLLVAIEYLTWCVARVYPISSDDATGVLEADAVIRGNLLLSGWTASRDRFIRHDGPPILRPRCLAPGRTAVAASRRPRRLLYGRCRCRLLTLAAGRHRGTRAFLGVVVVLVLLGLPAGGLAEFVTKGYIRVGTTLGFFAALLAIDVPAGRRVSPARVALFAVALTATLLADSFTLLIGVLPIMIVCGLGAARTRAYDDVGLWTIAIAACASVAAALGLSWLIEASSGSAWCRCRPWTTCRSRIRSASWSGTSRSSPRTCPRSIVAASTASRVPSRPPRASGV